MQKSVNLVDIVKSFPTSIQYFLANIGVDTTENESLKITDSAAGENTELVGSRCLAWHRLKNTCVLAYFCIIL